MTGLKKMTTTTIQSLNTESLLTVTVDYTLKDISTFAIGLLALVYERLLLLRK